MLAALNNNTHMDSERTTKARRSAPLLCVECTASFTINFSDYPSSIPISILVKGNKNYICAGALKFLVDMVNNKGRNTQISSVAKSPCQSFEVFPSNKIGANDADVPFVFKYGFINKHLEKAGGGINFSKSTRFINLKILDLKSALVHVIGGCGIYSKHLEVLKNMIEFGKNEVAKYGVDSTEEFKNFNEQSTQAPGTDCDVTYIDAACDCLPPSQIYTQESQTASEPFMDADEDADLSAILMSLTKHVSPKTLARLQRCVFEEEKVPKLESKLEDLTSTVINVSSELATIQGAMSNQQKLEADLRERISEIQRANADIVNTLLDNHSEIIARLNDEICRLHARLE